MAEQGHLHIDPISQFAIHPLWDFKLGGFDLSYTNSSLYMSLAIGLIALFFFVASRHGALGPSRILAAAAWFLQPFMTLWRLFSAMARASRMAL